MRTKKDQRGFAYAYFLDHYNQKCSLQKSSLAFKDAIWLGVENTGPHITGPTGVKNDGVNVRMHLTRLQDNKLLPNLIKFVETGEI